MGKKYIIEIPDEKIEDFVGSTHFLMPYMMAGHIGHHDTGLPIEPYTEPDIEQIRKEAYEEGKKQAKVQAELDVCHDIEKVAKENYKAGLADAWEAARKIVTMPDRDFINSDILDLDPGESIFTKYTASEAIAKIKEYEDSKQEYRVGDEFENGAGQKFVVLKMDGKEIDRYIDGDGKTYVMSAKYRVMRKTGRSFPEIAAVLEKMRGE